MKHKQGLVPITEALADLPDPVQAIREATPRRCTTSPRPIR